ncbi:glycosyl transferase, partial [bacterium]|nr:glycosyl transferase [bacterium]
MKTEEERMYLFYKVVNKIIKILHVESYLTDKTFLKIQFYISNKKKLNLKNPKSYNEKIQWLKLYDHNPLYPKIVDKYDVRKYVKDKIGEEYLIKCYGIYNSPNEIIFNEVPNSFVIKCTHDSGNVYICNDKNRIDKNKLENVYEGLKKNYFYKSREWPYKNLNPRLIIEENLSRNGTPPVDYKFMCFFGKVKFIQLHEDRFSNHKSYLYDVEGKPTNFNNVGNEEDNFHAPKLDMKLISKMISLAEKMANDFIHVRVDFYCVDNNIYFGELTLY